MATELQTINESKTINGQNVLDVATAIWQAVQAIYAWAGRRFPYNLPKLRTDLGQILLWGMADMITVQFYTPEDMVEKLSYEFVPGEAPTAVQSEPGDFPRHALDPSWKVRLIAQDTVTKPESEVREFYRQLGWVDVPPLTRTGEGTTSQYSAFKSGDFGVTCQVYSDQPDKDTTERKELVPHETL